MSNLLREYIRNKLIEQASNKGSLIVVDIQPEYEGGTTFDIGDMLRSAAEYDQVLFLYNGADTLGMIDEQSLRNYYFEKLDYDEEVYEELMSVSEFFDKGYGFFRDIMDSGICFDRSSVIKIVKYMIDNDVQDIRDLEEEDVQSIGVSELLFDDLEDYGFWVPELQDILPQWNGSDIAGGARNECLAEVEILAAAQGLSFRQVNEFIYEGDTRYTEGILKEDAIGFVHALAASDKFGDQFFGGQVSKEAGREIKRAFANNADHQFLNSLDTVHWTGDFYGMEGLKGKGRDELSATMTLPGDNFDYPLDYGLWIKGRITLAANDQDKLYSGFHGDYGAGSEGTEEEVAHRDKSSGRNKRPTVSKDYSRYGQLKRGNEFGEKMARDGIPYVLDQSTWKPVQGSSNNEALVDNWRPVGIILTRGDEINAISGLEYIEGNKDDIHEFAMGVVKRIMLTALSFGVPVYDTERELLWSPK